LEEPHSHHAAAETLTSPGQPMSHFVENDKEEQRGEDSGSSGFATGS
jgi:hypothetical protein